MAAPWIVPAIMAAGQIISTAVQNRGAKKRTEEMNRYNSPESQMKRYQQAGLNPHLIYGQGTAGNQSSPAPVASYAPSVEAIGAYNQTRMVNSQVAAQDAKTVKTQVETQVAQIQKKLMEANPLLNNEGFKATMDILKSTALIKTSEGDMAAMQATALMQSSGKKRNGIEYPMGMEKVFTEIELLQQRFNLGTADAKIKAEVLSSKEFQNAILEVQKKFMTDFELTPQNWLQFVQLLLQRL